MKVGVSVHYLLIIMTNFKKRGQSIIDEISENLKRTIKKYNEIEQDEESVGGLIEYQNEKNPPDSAKEEILKTKINNTNTYNSNNNNNTNYDNNNKAYNYGLNEKDSMSNLPFNNKTDGSSIKNKVKKFINDIDNLSSNMTKDFENIEELLEGIDKDLEILNKN
jgi:uncharacterized coiled-coil DUF342 family protein